MRVFTVLIRLVLLIHLVKLPDEAVGRSTTTG